MHRGNSKMHAIHLMYNRMGMSLPLSFFLSLQKFFAFLYNKYEWSERDIKKTIPSTIASKKIKISRNKPT